MPPPITSLPPKLPLPKESIHSEDRNYDIIVHFNDDDTRKKLVERINNDIKLDPENQRWADEVKTFYLDPYSLELTSPTNWEYDTDLLERVPAAQNFKKTLSYKRDALLKPGFMKNRDPRQVSNSNFTYPNYGDLPPFGGKRRRSRAKKSVRRKKSRALRRRYTTKRR